VNSHNSHLEPIIDVLCNKKIYRKYQKFLPTPDCIQEIIVLTNDGKIKQAQKKMRQLKNILDVTHGSIATEDSKWLEDIIFMLDSAINALEVKNVSF